jgi:hypothetical protein
MKYTKDDILQMLISQYKFGIEFDPVVIKGMDFNYESSIFEWQDACDLVETKKLAQIYHKEFNIKRPISELENILADGDNKTISDFCEYMSLHAEREKIEPIKLLGQQCTSAMIFRVLKQKLTDKGADTTGLKPSSEINPFFLKFGGQLFDEVNRIAPGTFSEFEYKSNKILRFGRNIMFFGVLTLICISWFWKFQWQLILPIILGIGLTNIGGKKQPEKLNISGFKNFRELIFEMEKKIKQSQHITTKFSSGV